MTLRETTPAGESAVQVTAAGSAAGDATPTRSSPVAELTDLTLRIPTTLGGRRAWVHAATGVHLEVRPGTVHALIGESGSGKSVLGSALLGLLPRGTRRSGGVRVIGTDMSAASERAWRKLRGRTVALAGQSAATGLTPTRTVGDQLAETIRTLAPGTARAAAPARAAELLGYVGLPTDALACYPHELSGGMAGRAVLAFALAGEPQLLVADEPTAGLDPALTGHVLELLASVARAGAGVLLITHDISSLQRTRIAQTVSVMYAGEVVETGSADAVLTAPSHAYSRALLRALPAGGLHPMDTPAPSLTHLEADA